MEKPMVFGGYRVCIGYDGRPLELERSALGVVTCKAEDKVSHEPVVLKIIPAASLESERLERLKKHVEQACVLQHINIARVLYFGQSGDDYIYVQEYVEGKTVASWVKQGGPMPMDVALRIGLQVAYALKTAAFHLNPHCAISPRNLVLSAGRAPTGEWPFVSLINFGLAELEFAEAAKQDAERLENDASIFYRSPEQARRRNVDIRSDIYSLGCTLWFLLMGAPPFISEGSSVLAPAVITEPPVEELKRLPESMRSLLGYMLRRDPEERPLDPPALIQVIEHSLARIERRQRFARRVGTPFLAPAYATKIKVAEQEEKHPAHTARHLVRIAAAGAIAMLLGALVAVGTSQLGRKSIFSAISRDKPIRVPIEVAEPRVTPVIRNKHVAENSALAAAEPKQPIASAAHTPVVAAKTTQSPVVETKVSQTPAAIAPPNQTSPAIAAANAPPPQIETSALGTTPNVSASAAPSQTAAAPIESTSTTSVAIHDAASDQAASSAPSRSAPGQAASRDNQSSATPAQQVAPPAEGPNEIAAAEPSPAQEPEPSPSVVTENEKDESNEVAADVKKETKPASASANRASRSRSAASKKTQSRRTIKLHEVRRALPPESETVPSTQSSRVIRAEFLGKTPDGNWILGDGGSDRKRIVPAPPPGNSHNVRENEVRVALPPD